ncbi:hypothetical protein ABII15_29900 [Streptomyces sp. HUAS MG91]|uniref:Uncharacterized protein n=1 Tax=Streptomyces tabacisoli TaxID=3156398 RepID=A0AAU8IZI5_9ACTN
MKRELRWPGCHVTLDAECLECAWEGISFAQFRIAQCAEASLRLRSPDGEGQLVFRFRTARSETADLVVVRLTVPASGVPGARDLVAELHHDHGVPDRPADEDETVPLEQVPNEPDECLLAPVGPASAEFFAHVMDRVGNDPH